MATHVPCPTCREPAPWQDNAARPFCSERCRLIDLGRWAEESYRIPCTTDAPPSASDEDE